MAETNQNNTTTPAVPVTGAVATNTAPVSAPATQAADVSQSMNNALGSVNQAAVQAQQTLGQAGEQAKQAVAKAEETAAQVSQQAQQLAGSATQTATQAQNLVKDLLMPKANQPKVGIDEKIFSMISYIPLVAFVSLIIKGDSRYVVLHGRQGLVLSILAFLNLFLALFPFIGGGLFGLVGFALFVVSVYSAYQALIGNWWKIPVLGDIAEMIPVVIFVQATKEAITGQVSDQNIEPQGQPESQAQGGPVQTDAQVQQTPPSDQQPAAKS